MGKNKKYAVLIGINYIGNDRELYGCINDSIVIRKYLIQKRGYLAKNITIIREDDPSFVYPSRVNIINKLTELVSKSANATELFFSYSGHGTYSLDVSGNDISENDIDEAYVSDVSGNKNDQYIVPINSITDGGSPIKVPPTDTTKDTIISDDEIRSILGNLNNNTPLLCIMDCCNSGTNLDLPYVYNQNGGKLQILQDNSTTYASLLGKKIYSLSGCRDDQLSTDASDVYKVMRNKSDKKFSIFKRNRAGGALTSTLIKILNKTRTKNFSNVYNKLIRNLQKNDYTQEPLLSSTDQTLKSIKTKNPKKPKNPKKSQFRFIRPQLININKNSYNPESLKTIKSIKIIKNNFRGNKSKLSNNKQKISYLNIKLNKIISRKTR